MCIYIFIFFLRKNYCIMFWFLLANLFLVYFEFYSVNFRIKMLWRVFDYEVIFNTFYLISISLSDRKKKIVVYYKCNLLDIRICYHCARNILQKF